jgi:hypothetical protein
LHPSCSESKRDREELAVSTAEKEKLKKHNESLLKKLGRMTVAVMGEYKANAKSKNWKKLLLMMTCKVFVQTSRMRVKCVSLLSSMASIMYVLHEDQLQHEVS